MCDLLCQFGECFRYLVSQNVNSPTLLFFPRQPFVRAFAQILSAGADCGFLAGVKYKDQFAQVPPQDLLPLLKLCTNTFA